MELVIKVTVFDPDDLLDAYLCAIDEVSSGLKNDAQPGAVNIEEFRKWLTIFHGSEGISAHRGDSKRPHIHSVELREEHSLTVPTEFINQRKAAMREELRYYKKD